MSESPWVTHLGRALPPVEIDPVHSLGSYVVEAQSGSEYLDLFGCQPRRALGFNHPALRASDGLLTSGQGVDCRWLVSPVCTQAVTRLMQQALAPDFSAVEFLESREAAVGFATQMVVHQHQGRSVGRQPQVITFSGACHGRHGLAALLSDATLVPWSCGLPPLDWPQLPSPTLTSMSQAQQLAVIEQRELHAEKALAATIARLGGAVAAVFVEPIQGAVGEHFFRSGFLQTLRALADNHGFLLVFDETDCGFGMTGQLWDYQSHGVIPDVLVFGGRMGVSGVAFRDPTLRLPLAAAWGPTGLCGSLSDFWALDRTLAVLAEDDLLTNARAVGGYLTKSLAELQADHPELSGVRGRGLIAAFDLPDAEARDRLVTAGFEEHLLMAPAGVRSIRLRPTLDVTADTIGRAMAQLDAALKRAQGKKT